MAYRRTERVERVFADKRERILQAVRTVVGEVGFRGAQVAMVADAAGVATGTVYRHFPSKAELFAETLALNAQHELNVMAAVVAADGPAAARLADAVRVFAYRAVEARRLAYAMMAEPSEAAVDAARLVYRRAIGELLEGVVRDGIAAGEFPPQKRGGRSGQHRSLGQTGFPQRLGEIELLHAVEQVEQAGAARGHERGRCPGLGGGCGRIVRFVERSAMAC